MHGCPPKCLTAGWRQPISRRPADRWLSCWPAAWPPWPARAQSTVKTLPRIDCIIIFLWPEIINNISTRIFQATFSKKNFRNLCLHRKLLAEFCAANLLKCAPNLSRSLHCKIFNRHNRTFEEVEVMLGELLLGTLLTHRLPAALARLQ